MQHPGFFKNFGPFRAKDLSLLIEAESSVPLKEEDLIYDVAPLSDSVSSDLSFLDNKKYLTQLEQAKAGYILINPALSKRVPAHCKALLTKSPYRSFALALARFYPEALRPRVHNFQTPNTIDPSAIIEDHVILEPHVVIGPEARIGRGSHIAAGASIGYRVCVGRDCSIGSSVSLSHSLIGDRVIIHPGARIGQDGFGFAMTSEGNIKVPQIGRVIIQDDVEIGANTTIDRGTIKDTIIGEGTKIDNLVQIGHNVYIGRHCIIAGQSAIAGSAVLRDFVVMGGQSGVIGHITVGEYAQIAGASHVKDPVPPKIAVCGTPARPFKQFARELATLSRIASVKNDNVTKNED
ncbi:MAG: UDP-3-O-(3-hydroxymyristoyl)glucosamine N-acyltransferase [Hyphomicrobium sp.]